MTQDPTGMGGDALAGMIPPERLINFVPAVAVTVPPQVLVTLAGLAITKTPGKVSEIAAPV
jgi:hypothetical protein